jgi:hypothetical protein
LLDASVLDQQFPITKTWLVLALCFNAAECWNAAVPFGLSAFIQHAANAERAAMGQPADESVREMDTTLSTWKVYFALAALGRAIGIASLVWLFQWRKLALWCYCISVLWNIGISAIGFEIITLLIDLALLAALGLLLTVIEPDSRKELA